MAGNIVIEDQGKLLYNADKLLNYSDEDLIEAIKFHKGSVKDCEEKLQQFHDWYEKQPHMPAQKLKNALLARLLINVDFSVEKLKDKIDNYYMAKHKIPELLINRDPLSPTLDKCFKQGYWVVLPKKTTDNCRVTVFRQKEPGVLNMAEMLKSCYMIADYRLLNDTTYGEHWIIDFQHATFQNNLQFHPMLISKISFFLMHCMAIKLKGLHLVNMPSYAETALNLFKKTMKKKVVERIHAYSSFEAVFTTFPKSIFPSDFGGDEMPSSTITDNWKETLQSPVWRDWFLAQEKAITDESKRVGPSKLDDNFGVDGSFRKLDLD